MVAMKVVGTVPEGFNVGDKYSDAKDRVFSGPAVMVRSPYPDEERFLIDGIIDGDTFIAEDVKDDELEHRLGLASDITVEGDLLKFENTDGESVTIRPLSLIHI